MITLTPLPAPVEAEIDILPRDVGFLRPGDATTIKVIPFNYTQNDEALGSVKWISEGELVLNDDTGQPGEPYYRVRVSIDQMNFINVPANFRLILRHDPRGRRQGRPPHPHVLYMGHAGQGRRRIHAGAVKAMGATQMLGAQRNWAPGPCAPASTPMQRDNTPRPCALAFRQSRRRAGRQSYIGELYERGEGVLSSPVDAAAWYRRAAVKGHVEAQFRLGRLYLRGGRHLASTDGFRDRSRTVRNSPIGSRRLFSPRVRNWPRTHRLKWIGLPGRRKPTIRSPPRCWVWCCLRVKASSPIPPPRCAG